LFCWVAARGSGLMTITNFLSIDVEDYFQVSAFEHVSPSHTWDHFESRVDRNTSKILDILQESGSGQLFSFSAGWRVVSPI